MGSSLRLQERVFFCSLRLVLQVVNLFLCLAVKRLSDQFIASNHRDFL